MKTGFFWDERCFWHSGGNYATTMPVGGLVQPQAAGGLPENPETKRRLKNLMDVTGLMAELSSQTAPVADWDTLCRIHPESYLKEFKELSDNGGGELGRRTPFGQGGFEIAALAAGLATGAIDQVMQGALTNAYALSRPPGHHCLPDFPNGFCLLNNIAIAVEAARHAHGDIKVAVLDWDVHHGNGTEAIYYDRNDTLAISLHQERNYPIDTGDLKDRGKGAGQGYNINVPLPAGTGHVGYLAAMDRIVLPALERFKPDLIVVACGYDGSGFDPLAQMLMTPETFRGLTERIKSAAESLCNGRLVLVHEGGYSEVYVPFCGHATIATLAESSIDAPDPLAVNIAARQPSAVVEAFQLSLIDEMAAELAE